jgi:hypothetical protein
VKEAISQWYWWVIDPLSENKKDATKFKKKNELY